jgi:hypothetical protein
MDWNGIGMEWHGLEWHRQSKVKRIAKITWNFT